MNRILQRQSDPWRGAMRKVKRPTYLERRQSGITPWPRPRASRSPLGPTAPQVDPRASVWQGLPRPPVFSPAVALPSTPTEASGPALSSIPPGPSTWTAFPLLRPSAELLLNLILDMTTFAKPSCPPLL